MKNNLFFYLDGVSKKTYPLHRVNKLLKLLIGDWALRKFDLNYCYRLDFCGILSSSLENGYGPYSLRIEDWIEIYHVQGYLHQTQEGVAYTDQISIQRSNRRLGLLGEYYIRYEEGKIKFIGQRETRLQEEQLYTLLEMF